MIHAKERLLTEMKETNRDHRSDADGRVAGATPSPEPSDAGFKITEQELHKLKEIRQILRGVAESAELTSVSFTALAASEEIRTLLVLHEAWFNCPL